LQAIRSLRVAFIVVIKGYYRLAPPNVKSIFDNF